PNREPLSCFEFMIYSDIEALMRRMARKIRSTILSIGVPNHASPVQTLEERRASEEISVIVAVHDAPAVVRRCLSSLEKYAPLAEIIVVDDGSLLEETRTLLADFCNRNRWKMLRHQ